MIAGSETQATQSHDTITLRRQEAARLNEQAEKLGARAEALSTTIKNKAAQEIALQKGEEAARAQHAEQVAAVNDIARQVDQAQAHIETLRRRIEGDGLTLQAVAATTPADDHDEAQRRATRIRSRLRALPVASYTVIDEHESESARLTSLTTQSADLRMSEANLMQAIGTLEARIGSQFEKTFEAVNTEFQKYFARLFEGGSARLGISAEGEGIDIDAQPPGKRPQSLALLSGGERALTAAALIFALLKVNPIPFCVLDEVDAALDESNVKRFVEAIQELSALTQFVVITHNRVTMEASSAVFGLAVAPDASTRIVSVRLQEQAA